MRDYYSEIFGEWVLLAGEFSRYGAVGDRAVYTDSEIELIRRHDNETKRVINLIKKMFDGRLVDERDKV